MEFLVIIASYLLGSIPSGLIVGKVGFGLDIREHGSGNLGGTNSFRILGKKAGLLVTLSDILKGTLATSLPFLFHLDTPESFALIAGAFAVIGHMYPIFAGFRGGKAVATSAGVILAYSPIIFLLLFLVFSGCLLLSKYVSLSSMLTGITGIILSLLKQDVAFIVVMILLNVFVFYRHRANIKRIMNKTEPKVKLF